METKATDNLDDRVDRATAGRLAKLRSLPVDTSRMDARLRDEIPQPAVERRRFFLFHPMQAAAAIFLVGIIVAAIVFSSGRPAMASAEQLARLHDEMDADGSHMMKVDSIEAASVALAGQWKDAPALPQVPENCVMSCCVHAIGGKKVACVSLTVDKVRLTMTVADKSQLQPVKDRTITRNGASYQVGSSNGVNMAMMERGGRWVCLMGRLPVERLIDVVGEMKN